MSWTMILGRVVLPAIGLVLAVTLTWQSVRNTAARTEVVAGRRGFPVSIARPDHCRRAGRRLSRRRGDRRHGGARHDHQPARS